ncbi:class I SAM-dependent RNA methyltransferase [Shimia marina]|uniref:23S rRNA (Uracil(1939)-C(5))-methyltransferase RlmD n=1 Tax=Shimia marina TaxID=321267 RepID=A0A0P1F7U6_9RHOB|nr:class I SAM-dependent RNA methyltransferase [Shimia marina]CUH51536.1 23S rRNA (uracil(1939)-C(5))-methyltransferase RlmD [Shimia marina]SFD46694.1 23S rRNA m(5)U-1939 methyltransferase [Shimia marina]
MSQITIQRLGLHGDGIADGPLYAPLTLPTEIIEGEVEGNRLKNIRIVEPSAHRVKAPCRHFKSCGGCQLQHATDGFLADWKVEIVRQALAAQGVETDLKPIITSPPRSRRRAVLSARRTKKSALVGFHARASDIIVDVPDCQLLHPDLMPALDIVAELCQIAGSRKGEISATVSLSETGLDLAVRGGKPLEGPLLARLAQETERFGLARLSWDGEVIATRTPPYQKFGDARVVPPPGAFLQATKDGEAALLAAVQEAITGGKSGIDLFAGCGTFTLPMARYAQMHGIEGEKTMVTALDAGWRSAQGLKKVTAEARDLFRNPVIAEDLRYDFAIIDPPRAGAEAQIAELARSKIAEIAYVSCNPVTFARDAATLIHAGYALEWVQTVDQFRWSSHIELASRFVRN